MCLQPKLARMGSLVYERHGEMRIWGYTDIYIKDLFKIKAMVKQKDIYDTSYSTKHEDFTIFVQDFKEKSDALHLFFSKATEVYRGYIDAFTDTLSFYRYTYAHAFEDAMRTLDSRFFLRCNRILNLEHIDDFKAFQLKYKNLANPIRAKQVGNDDKILSDVDEQHQLLQEHNIPTLAENPSFYADDLGIEDAMIVRKKLI